MNKKVKFLSVVTTLALAASMGATAFANNIAGGGTGTVGGTQPADNGTEVWAGIAVDAPEQHLLVKVPTLFAFVVNGTVDSAQAGQAISTTTGGLLLPNVKVTNVTTSGDYDTNTPSAAGDTYDITTAGESAMLFENLSTQYNGTNYEGLEVEVVGTIRNEGTEADRNGWSHVGSAPSGTAGQDFKKYQLTVTNLDGTQGGAFTSRTDGSFGMESAITLAAPDTLYNAGNQTYGNLNTTTNVANTGTVEEVKFDVAVGGVRGDYDVIEESAKIGTISWEVSANASVPTT